jgi:hypothetical protein
MRVTWCNWTGATAQGHMSVHAIVSSPGVRSYYENGSIVCGGGPLFVLRIRHSRHRASSGDLPHGPWVHLQRPDGGQVPRLGIR